jgi:hypothetical protein
MYRYRNSVIAFAGLSLGRKKIAALALSLSVPALTS